MTVTNIAPNLKQPEARLPKAGARPIFRISVGDSRFGFAVKDTKSMQNDLNQGQVLQANQFRTVPDINDNISDKGNDDNDDNGHQSDGNNEDGNDEDDVNMYEDDGGNSGNSGNNSDEEFHRNDEDHDPLMGKCYQILIDCNL